MGKEQGTGTTGLPPVGPRDEETFVYCSMPGCGRQIDVHLPEGSPYTIDGCPICESCAIEH